MIGCGRANIAGICDLARAQVADGISSEAVDAISSLGAGGRHEANQERDLHRWLKNLYNVNITPYKFPMTLIVTWCSLAKVFLVRG